MTLPAGTRLGPYEILAPIGSGGMGEVYRGRDTKLQREVAIKVLSPRVEADPAAVERFEREARAVAALNHPNIVTIHAVESLDGRPALVMELVDGSTLEGQIREGGLALDTVLCYAISLADALSAAHTRGVTHRDLKPSNVMIARDGRLKVLDFGLARLRDHGGGGTAGGHQPALSLDPTAVARGLTAQGHSGNSRVHVAGAGSRRCGR